MDDLDQDPSASHHPMMYGSSPEFEIGVPFFQDGLLCYTFAGMASSYEPGADFASWMTLRPPLLDGSHPTFPSPYPPPPPQSPRQQLHHSRQASLHHLPQQLQQKQQQQQQQQQQPQQQMQMQMQFRFQHQQAASAHFAQPGQQSMQLQHTFIQEHPSAGFSHAQPHQQLQQLQLPPQAASRAFPVSTAEGVGDTMLAGSSGVFMQ